MIDTRIIRVVGNQGFGRVTFEESEDVIIDMARKGYHFKGSVPIRIFGYGAIREIDLVFEKEE